MLSYKKYRKSQRKNSFLFLFVRTYLILLTVLFSAVMIVSVYLLHTSRERQEEIGLNEMEKASTMFLQQIKELQDISCMLSEDSAVQTVAGLEKDLSPSDYIHLIELNDTLKRYYIFNENTKGINLWFGKNGIVHLGNSTISSAEHSSYKENYRFGTMGYDEYFDAFYQSGQMEQLECVQVKNGTSQDTKIFYCVNLDILAAKHDQICAFYEINNAALEKLFTFFSDDAGCSVRLLNAGGEVLYQNTETSFTEEIPKKNTEYVNGNLLLYRDSTSFSCQVLVPKSYIDNEVRQLQWYLFIPMGILLLFGVGFSFFWSYRYALPLQKTVDSLHIGNVSSVQTEKGLNAIYYSVQELVKNEAQIQQALSEEKILRKDEFFSDLLFSGVVVSDQFVQERARSLNISADYAYYTVVYDHFELLPDDQDIQDDGSILIKSAILNRTLYTLIPQMVGFYRPQMSQNGILIIGLDQPDRQEIKELMEQVFMLLWKEYHIRLYCTIGVPVKRLGMISESYLAAKYKMEHSPMGEEVVLLAQENQFMNGPIEYSAAMENTLIRSCLSGDSERTLEILDHIFQNTAEINATDLTQLIYSFRATILRVLTEVTGEDINMVASDSRHLTSCQNGEELRSVVMRIFRTICELVRHEADSKRDLFYFTIEAYIREHYADPDLTLTSTADHFHMNEKYLSHFFKEVGKINFSSAVEKIRMEEVIRYMKETDLPIAEICMKCGYSSSNSFYKAFKRVYGVSPNTYRKGIHEKYER